MNRRWKIVLGGLFALAALAAIVVAVAVRQLEPRLHDWVASSLDHSLQSEVQLGEVRLHWYPLRLTARDLTVRHRGRADIPPLIVVASFTVDLKPFDLWNATIEEVRVEGLEVNIPPKDDVTGSRPLPRPPADGHDRGAGLVVRRLTATNARLSIVPKTEGKNPKVWDIFELEMQELGRGAPARFRAALINPIPYGTIETSGRFGPWDPNEPGTSAIEGEYTFAADLGTIKGLHGQLSAIGTMTGVLAQVHTRGETRTPDFRLTALTGGSLPLTTSYEAVVDGTKGDVELTSVHVTLGKSPLLARGVVEGTHGRRGKRIVLSIASTQVDLAELLHLASATQPPMARGTAAIDAAFTLPQGSEEVLERLELTGSLRAGRLRFADDHVQEEIDTLSRRGQGRPADRSIENVGSNVAGSFSLRRGIVTHRALAFAVPGATVSLDGTHHLQSKTLALEGEVRLNASISNTLTGFKRWLAKPLDPLFHKHGAGTRLVIRVDGTQDHPKVGLELGKTLRGK